MNLILHEIDDISQEWCKAQLIGLTRTNYVMQVTITNEVHVNI